MINFVGDAVEVIPDVLSSGVDMVASGVDLVGDALPAVADAAGDVVEVASVGCGGCLGGIFACFKSTAEIAPDILEDGIIQTF